jgi:hypothetical protein
MKDKMVGTGGRNEISANPKKFFLKYNPAGK